MNWIVIFTLLLQGQSFLASQEDRSGNSVPTPTPEQYVWHEQERIMFVCLDPCTWQNREYDNFSTPLDSMVLPDLDTDQWCAAAVSWGAREILFVAKHTGGFCWWQTETTDYSVKSIPWRGGEGDLLEELAASCSRFGLNLGIYVYPGDESWGAGIGSGGKTRDPSKQEAYNMVFRTQLRETLVKAAKYTHVTEVWFDGSCVIEVGDILEKYAPHAVVFQGPHASIRWVGNERGRLEPANAWSTLTVEDLATGTATSTHSTPDGKAWAPLEVNTTLYDHHWFWSEEKAQDRKSLDELMRFYYASVGNGAVMLLNSTPNTRGLIPETDMQLYEALGDEIRRRFDTPLGTTSGRDEGLVLDFDGPALVNHVTISEDYWFGERIRQFYVEGLTGGTWQKLAEGKHVGRKRILWFDEVPVSGLRLRITASAGSPLIRDFSAWHVSDFRPAPGASVVSTQRQCGNWDLFGRSEMDLTIDLTPYIDEPNQYEIVFRPVQEGDPVTISDEAVYQAGQKANPGILTRKDTSGRVLHFSRTAVVTEDTNVTLQVKVSGKESSGVVLVKKLQ
jgi:alpha-L-fucosidase